MKHNFSEKIHLFITMTAAAVTLAACGGSGSSPSVIRNENNLAPSNVKLLEVSSSTVGEIAASWLPSTDDATPEDKIQYQLHASTGSDFTPSASTLMFQGQGIYSAKVQSGLTPGAKYTLKLVAIDGQGAQTASNPMIVTVSDTPAQSINGTKVTTVASNQVSSLSSDTVVLKTGLPAPKIGEFIASIEGNGYLRKVMAVSTTADGVALQTRNASLNETISDVKISSMFQMISVPREVTTTAQQIGLVRRESTVKNPSTEYAWEHTGFRYAAPASTAPASNLPAGLAGNFQVGLTQTGLVTEQGSWGKMVMPGTITITEGESAKINLHGYITDLSNPIIGDRRKICAIQFGAMKSKGDNSKPELVNISTETPITNKSDAYRPTHLIYPTTVKAGVGTANTNPYTVDVNLRIEELGEDCNTQTLWDETVHQTLKIYVVNDNAVLRENETAKPTFEGSAGLTVSNEINFSFQPTVAFEQQLENTKLKYALIELKAAPRIEQTLTINATAAGSVEKTVPIITTRKFYKLYMAGQVPIIISGAYKMDMTLKGDVTGAIDATEKLTVGYDELAYGLKYENGQYQLVKNIQPVYKVNIGGNGKAEANLEIMLQPSLEITAYEVATGRVILEPYFDSHAGIEGHVQIDTEQDFNTWQTNQAADADYRLTKATLGGGVRVKLGADLTVFDYTLAAWPEKDQLKTYDIIKQTDFWSIPTMSAQVVWTDAHPTNTQAIKVKATATPLPNPLKNLFSEMSDTFVTWSAWKNSRVVPQLGVASSSYQILQPESTDGTAWVVLTQPGMYKVRQGGHSSIGTWARQYVETEIEILDANHNGIPDWWEQRYDLTGSGAAIAAADPDNDGLTNFQEWLAGSDPRKSDGAARVTGITPVSVIPGQSTVFRIVGINLPLTAVMNINDAAASCTQPTNNTTAGFITICTVSGSAGGTASASVMSKSGGALLQRQSISLVNGTSCTASHVMQDGTCISLATIKASNTNPSILQKIQLWLVNVWEGAKQVTWSFTDGIQSITESVTKIIEQSFSSSGSKTVTATYKDANNNTLGSSTVTVNVQAATVSQTARITGVSASSGAKIGAVADKASTDDNTPTLAGTISAPLAQMQTLRISHGDTVYTTTPVGTVWTLTLPTLADGTYTFKAAVYHAGYMVEGASENTWTVTIKTTNQTATGKIPHTGITADQCYAAGSNALVSCTSAEAIALSGAGKQDGMYANVNPMSYSTVGSYSIAECVKDNVTGLIWEGKTVSGLRAGVNGYTNLGNNQDGDASTYIAQVNAERLCGGNNWRLPTADELTTLVNYGADPSLKINSLWFPNTFKSISWASNSVTTSTDNNLSWYTTLDSGFMYYSYTYNRLPTTLVRTQ